MKNHPYRITRYKPDSDTLFLGAIVTMSMVSVLIVTILAAITAIGAN